MKSSTGAAQQSSDVFWGEIAPSEHVVQIYGDDGAFLDSLHGFVAGGLEAGEGVIVVATDAHLMALDERLRSKGIDVWSARGRDEYIPLDASETLNRFLMNGWPDEYLFEQTVTELLSRAGRNDRRVRAFGEMVAVLWAQGLSGATVRLEHLWQGFCQANSFSLFCAYPRSGFTQDADASIQEICAAHSRVIS